MSEIGDILRQARLKKGYSVEELQQITKIQQRYLLRIEDNNFEALPGTFYVRSFIEQYALAVDINPEPLLKALEQGNFEVQETKAVPVKKKEAIGEVSRRQIRASEPPKKTKGLLPVILLVLVVLLIVSGVVAMTILDRKSNPIIARPPAVIINSSSESSSVETETTTSSTKEESTESTTVETTTTTSSEEVKPEFAITSQNNLDIAMTLNHVKNPINLEFTGLTTGPCWIGIIVNGDYTYQHTLQPGEVVASALPEGVTQARVVLGAAGNAQVKVNGEDLPFNQANLKAVKRNLDLTITYQ